MQINIKQFIAVFLLLALPSPALGAAVAAKTDAPFAQEFIITAYYSPLPDQCCYVRGSYEDDVALNGRGTNGASGIDVHAGMAAAPSSYPFGTRITLPGIGTVTVEDRGGAIQTLETGVQRLDIWVGSGEEGLARALAFGAQHVTGTVYFPGQMQPPEAMAIENLPSPLNLLSDSLTDEDLLAVRPKLGDRGLSVRLLQNVLKNVAYFTGDVTGFYGAQTQAAVRRFQRDFRLKEAPDALNLETAATLLAAKNVSGSSPLQDVIQPGSSVAKIRDAQRTLRYLGFYRGRTNGVYDATLKRAVLAFQRKQGIVNGSLDSGAGIIGPKTKSVIAKLWMQKRITERSQNILLLAHVDDVIRERGILPKGFLSKGDEGKDVRNLQQLLVDRGFLKKDRVTGTFGAETEKAMIAFQLKQGIIKTAKDTGAGRLGPGTKHVLLAELRDEMFKRVQSKGLRYL